MDGMVVEELVFIVEPGDVARWVAVEHDAWDGFLRAQRGFVRKEVWLGTAEEPPGTVRVLVWWASKAEWDAVDPDGLERVDASLGPDRREPRRCVAHRVVRTA